MFLLISEPFELSEILVKSIIRVEVIKKIKRQKKVTIFFVFGNIAV